jgi:hypothetical protein
MRPGSKRNRPHLALRARYRDGEIAFEAREPSAIIAVVVLLSTVAIVALVVAALR